MTKKELNEWYIWYKQYKNGYHLSDSDKQQLKHLNYKVMEMAHEVHNNSMMGDLKND